ncbi:hypothetical protein PF005_g19297 [Phytophthora fragariae]|uniref:Retrotransposon gag domain-containing protein n=1 Tax=Phytophthora fragariae TaxID=53985 RepID=A0A6A3WZE0_9STRA|nr:hypothetical protein PF003_g39489 [Phytophthora fragariae]KAE8929663.1 hypothetical protein PF009_g20225 [Phytophthora fragariae]KAE8991180.1 hypothetical protein PF011_g18044 [Phytophthora fragariae]KAE9090044.1 hypothetical protein PF007_g19382 [Phytophthora fragariae]KAE9143347.1 hypothetical protein PF006_g11617 [Phytophthora fragariae]
MPTWASSPSTPMREAVREYHRPKKMRVPKYKGLDGNMAVSTWLRAVQTETRRQERTLGVHWDPDEVYYEIASHLEGEALRWYGNIMSAITDETDENMARLLRPGTENNARTQKSWPVSTTGSRCGVSPWLNTQPRCER